MAWIRREWSRNLSDGVSRAEVWSSDTGVTASQEKSSWMPSAARRIYITGKHEGQGECIVGNH
ncbi:MAG: hypothetical protein ACE5L7_11850, partial [Candidatus Aminicenantales bacterium]